MSKIEYTWEELNNDTRKIANWVKEVGFKPDGIVGIIRGGAVPAVILSHELGCPVTLLNWSLRDGKVKDYRELDKIAIAASHGKRFLFIDDIVDSGATIKEIKDRAFDTKNNLLFTSLWYNPSQLNSRVHFWARIIDRSLDDRWVIFPYE